MNGLAALAEATVADLLGLEWDQGDTPDKGVDVGENIGLRHTCLAHGSLIVHPEDRDDCVQVLVTGTTHPLTVVGWIPNRDAKLPEYWREKGVRFPAFFVPRKALRPIEELFPSGIIPNPERTP